MVDASTLPIVSLCERLIHFSYNFQLLILCFMKKNLMHLNFLMGEFLLFKQNELVVFGELLRLSLLDILGLLLFILNEAGILGKLLLFEPSMKALFVQTFANSFTATIVRLG